MRIKKEIIDRLAKLDRHSKGMLVDPHLEHISRELIDRETVDLISKYKQMHMSKARAK